MATITSKLNAQSNKLKKKNIKVKHQKLKLLREFDESLMAVFMWGINYTINELNRYPPPALLIKEDFQAYSKIEINNRHFNEKYLPSEFKVKVYCPNVFRNLREKFKISDEIFQFSLTRSFPRPVDFSGRSGSKCYASDDNLYIIKLLQPEEFEAMHSFLKSYHPYIVEKNGRTLLPHYLTMYRITVEKIEYYLVVMRNIFSSHLKINCKYDLKGSTVDRDASKKEKRKPVPVFKDNDFIKQGVKISIGAESKKKLMETLTSDVEFLKRLDIMDYSLLVGIHDCEKNEKIADSFEMYEEFDDDDDDESAASDNEHPSSSSSPDQVVISNSKYSTKSVNINSSDDIKTGYALSGINPEVDIYAIPTEESSSKKGIYFMGIIDVLTYYGVKKQAAKTVKTVKYGANADGISTVEPDQYSKRFLDFISKLIE